MASSEILRVVIVDDEAPARSLLREYLGTHADIAILGECANGFEAVKAIAEHTPDLVFLDVQMPKLDGFEVLELLQPAPIVVFCTAYDEFALKAFEVHAVDYLLKPFGRERLAEALVRARMRMAEKARAAARTATPEPPPPAASAPDTPSARIAEDASPAALAEAARARSIAATARPSGRHLERIIVRDGGSVQVIPVESVDFVEAQDDYISIHAGGKTWLKSEPLGELAESLDPARFVRVHRSYILHVERLARLELYAKDSRVAILKDGRQIPVSRSGYARLQELM